MTRSRPSAAPPRASDVAREVRSRHLNRRDFDLAAAIDAAEQAARDLRCLLRLHSVFKVKHAVEWFKAEIAKARR